MIRIPRILTVSSGLLLTLGTVSCQRSVDHLVHAPKEQVSTQVVDPSSLYDDSEAYEQGAIVLKLNEGHIPALSSHSGKLSLHNAPTALAQALHSIKANELTPLFPEDSRYAKRHRRAGLHLWYQVSFDTSTPVTQAMASMTGLDEVELVEAFPVIEPMSVTPSPLADLGRHFQRSAAQMPFNDPRLKEQWHYNNDGSLPNTVMGCDINLFKAWEITTGTPNVIVAIVDGGMDYEHEDLKDNMWINQAEQNGQLGVDDDNNGYIDDIYGYCFVEMRDDIIPDDSSHGTHVAGTVGARTNNGKGVAGIAGGNGTPESGVRMMSTAVFRAGSRKVANNAAAIVYGADNGAVISQNSWGMPRAKSLPSYLKLAIDYFNEYAGCDEEGNQLPNSPMKGGLMIFAVGNTYNEFRVHPGSYEGVIAVAAAGPEFKKASYTTYGDYVDLSAPGGEGLYPYKPMHGVLSTTNEYYSITGGTYTFMEGSSMACPHVSGIAALVVSKMGGPGFTNEMLRERLLASVAPINIDELNPGYEGKLGLGIIDAYLALTIENKGKKPNAPQIVVEKSTDKNYLSIPLTWVVPTDEDDGAPVRYRAFVATEPLNSSNYTKVGKAAGNANGFFFGNGKEAGEEITGVIKGLHHSTKYYVGLVAVDRWGHESEPVFAEVSTRVNRPVDTSGIPTEPLTLVDVDQVLTRTINFADPDGHKWTYRLKENVKGLTLKQEGNALEFKVRPVLPEGDYTIELILTDELGTETTARVPLKIVKVGAPQIVTPLKGQIVGVKNGAVAIDLKSAFGTNANLPLTFTAKVQDGSLATATVDPQSGKLVVTGVRPGQTQIQITADNGYKSTHTSVDLLITDDINRSVYAVWPIPVGEQMNVWISPKYKQANLKLVTFDGRTELTEQISTDAQGIARVSTAKVAPGQYQLVLTFEDGKSQKRAVLKK